MTEWPHDSPSIRIHVTTFSNVTCIGFTLPHIYGDVPGMSIILRAWCSIIAGHEAELPALFDGDPRAHIGGPYPSSAKELKELYEDMEGDYHIAGWWEKIRYYAPIVLEMVFYPKEQARMIFLSESILVKLRQAALAELDDGKEVWVSENDIVFALMVKVSLCVWHKTTSIRRGWLTLTHILACESSPE